MIPTLLFDLTAILVGAIALTSCAIDPDDLPDVQPLPSEQRDSPIEMSVVPLDRISLVLAAEDGNTDLIADLFRESGAILWSRDGAVAVRLSARRGHADVIELLLTYGACMDRAPVCFAALDEARTRNHVGVVLQLEAALGVRENNDENTRG